jgi:hypothetical protein
MSIHSKTIEKKRGKFIIKTACLFYTKKKITWRTKKEVKVLNKNKKISEKDLRNEISMKGKIKSIFKGILSIVIIISCIGMLGRYVPQQRGIYEEKVPHIYQDISRKSVIDISDNVNKDEPVCVFELQTNQKNTPGYSPANEGECVTSDTFFIEGNCLFLDDSVNHRILEYNKNTLFRIIDLPWNVDVKNIFYNSEEKKIKLVYVDLSKTNAEYYHFRVLDYQSLNILVDKELSNDKKIITEICFSKQGEIQCSYLDRIDDQYIADDTEKIEQLMDTYVDCHLCTVDKDSNTSTVIGKSIDKKMNTKNTFIVNCTNGIPLESASIVESDCSYLNSSIQNIDDKIYQMVIDDKFLKIYKLNITTIKNPNSVETISEPLDDTDEANSGIINLSYFDASLAEKTTGILRTSVKKQSKSTVDKRVNKWLNYSWKYNNKKNRNTSILFDQSYKNYVKAPAWLSHYVDEEEHDVTGIPYCWGAWNSSSFISKIQDGYYAGNVFTTEDYKKKDGNTKKDHGLVGGTVGMDCSGFISVIFDLDKKYSTDGLITSGYFSAQNNAKAGDILDQRRQHVVYIKSISYDNMGNKYCYIAEESKSAGRIRYRTVKLSTMIADGYSIYRYTNFTD